MKYVVDVERGLIALGGELHVEAVEALLEAGSRQADLWERTTTRGAARRTASSSLP